MDFSKKWHKLKNILGLSLSLARANFKLKNEGSYLGVLWYLLDPLIMFIIFFLVKNIVGKGIPNYPLYLLIGLILFNFFRKTTNEAVGAITGNSGLIKSVKINYEVFVVSIFLNRIFSHIFEIILVAIVMILFDTSILGLVFYFGVFIFYGMFVLGISFLVSTIGVYISDFGKIWSLSLRLLWFATPIFYSSKIVLPIMINPYNPIYYFISATRDFVIYGRIPELWIIFGVIFFPLLSLVLGIYIFEKYKGIFAEKI